MSQEPLLSPHYDSSLDDKFITEGADAPIKDDAPLTVGKGDCPFSRAKARVGAMSRARRAMLAGGVALFAIVLLLGAVGGCRRHSMRRMRGGYRVSEFHSPNTPAKYGPYSTTLRGDESFFSANATFPSLPTGGVGVQFINMVAARVVISRSADNTPAHVVVESDWQAGLAIDSAVALHAGPHATLVIDGTRVPASHTVHLVLPADQDRMLSPIWIDTMYGHNGKPPKLSLELHPSAESTQFEQLHVATSGPLILPAVLAGGRIHLSTVTSDITGSFNVTRGLTLRTVAGNIDADLWVPGSNNGHGHGHGHSGDKHYHDNHGKHGGKHHHDHDDKHGGKHHHDHDDKHGDKHHDHHGKGKGMMGMMGMGYTRGRGAGAPCNKQHPRSWSAALNPFSRKRSNAPTIFVSHGPVVVDARTTAGNVDLRIKKTSSAWLVASAEATTGNVNIDATQGFFGRFEATTSVGETTVKYAKGKRLVHVYDRRTAVGHSVRGEVVCEKHGPAPHGPPVVAAETRPAWQGGMPGFFGSGGIRMRPAPAMPAAGGPSLPGPNGAPASPSHAEGAPGSETRPVPDDHRNMVEVSPAFGAHGPISNEPHRFVKTTPLGPPGVHFEPSLHLEGRGMRPQHAPDVSFRRLHHGGSTIVARVEVGNAVVAL